jgi:hypothetical protein
MARTGEDRNCTSSWWESLWERDHSEDQLEWIQLAQDRDRWQAL